MNNNIVLRTDRLNIKTLHINDITPEYVRGLNDPEINKFLVNVRLHKQTKNKVVKFVSDNLRSPHDILLGAFLKEDNVFIGTIRIGNVSTFHRFCTVGVCFFNRKYWGKGYASESMDKVCDYIFKKMKLHYIEAGVYSRNTASIKLFKRVGFSLSAIHPNKYRWHDNFEEVSIFHMINQNFNYELIREGKKSKAFRRFLFAVKDIKKRNIYRRKHKIDPAWIWPCTKIYK